MCGVTQGWATQQHFLFFRYYNFYVMATALQPSQLSESRTALIFTAGNGQQGGERAETSHGRVRYAVWARVGRLLAHYEFELIVRWPGHTGLKLGIAVQPSPRRPLFRCWRLSAGRRSLHLCYHLPLCDSLSLLENGREVARLSERCNAHKGKCRQVWLSP